MPASPVTKTTRRRPLAAPRNASAICARSRSRPTTTAGADVSSLATGAASTAAVSVAAMKR
jgi:hypothetical protein